MIEGFKLMPRLKPPFNIGVFRLYLVLNLHVLKFYNHMVVQLLKHVHHV
jgi:hypothetical protein